MEKFIAILMLTAFMQVGCKSMKNKAERQEGRDTTEQVKKTTVRKGDTVTYVVPNIILKDTTITKTNTVTGTTQVLRYDSEGRLSAAECISGFITIIEEHNKRMIELMEESSKQKESEIPASTILYAFIGLALFFVIIGVVAFKVIGGKFNTLANALTKISDKVVN